MIRRTFRSAPVIGRVQECVAMFRRTIGGEAEAHAKAKSESVRGQNRGTHNRRNHHKAIEPKIRGDVTKKPKIRGEVIPMGRATVVDDPVRCAAQGKKKGRKDLEAQLAAAKLRYGPCGVCGKEKDHTSAGCPYMIHIPNPLEVTLVDGRYGIVCDCCTQPGGHPARRGWTGRATLKLCTYCMVLGEHWTIDCPCVEPQQRENWRKEMREDDILGEEPKKEKFLDLKAYMRDLRMKAELKLYDA
ncbi:hypothetical protein D8674_025617 [Pyrus ussuriensis x Pyrus communis]|uniref:Uncharacterized protein n=1 Tax=Pyrus ussuriensis x Pyrus communis TaxID=2448454 RepID=A0A5N5I7E5_9ROSA|nr:hypothetical protein D8674_025617 [Pyrus ussuriensis x Pyrus communis]